MASPTSSLPSTDSIPSSSDSTSASPPLSLSSPTVGVKVPTQVLRERERRSRQNRRKKFEKMLANVASLERTELALRVMPDADPIWDEFLDDDTKRTRARLQRFVTVANEVKRLTSEKAQLQRLLTERELARRAVGSLMRAVETADKWATNCEKWKALTRIHFQPLTTSECVELMNDAIAEMTEYLGDKNKQSSGVTFMGWQESRRATEMALQFTLFKTYQGYDLNHHIEMAWRMHAEAALYSRVILGGRGRVYIEVVQKISPTAWVIHIAMTSDETDVTVHDIFLHFQVKTEDGAFICARGLKADDLQRAIETPSDLWISNITWIEWTVLDPLRDWSWTDYRMCVGGSLHANHPAAQWFMEFVAIVVRSENFIAGRPMLEFTW